MGNLMVDRENRQTFASHASPKDEPHAIVTQSQKKMIGGTTNHKSQKSASMGTGELMRSPYQEGSSQEQKKQTSRTQAQMAVLIAANSVNKSSSTHKRNHTRSGGDVTNETIGKEADKKDISII